MEIMAYAEEEALVIEEICVIRDVVLANTVYTIPEVSEEHTPTLEVDSVKTDSDTDSDVSIEPYLAQGDAYGVVEEVPSDSVQKQTGEPVDVIIWPPRVLEDQPLTLILKGFRDPVSQMGSLGALPPGISPASSASSERIFFEPAALC